MVSSDVEEDVGTNLVIFHFISSAVPNTSIIIVVPLSIY